MLSLPRWTAGIVVLSCSGLSSQPGAERDGAALPDALTPPDADAAPGVLTTIATGAVEPVILASDGETLFMTQAASIDPGGAGVFGPLSSIPASGGPPTPLQPNAILVGVDATNVYFLSNVTSVSPGVTSFYLEQKRSSSGTLVRLSDGVNNVISAAIANGSAYWAASDSTNGYFDLYSYPLPSGPALLTRIDSASSSVPTLIAPTSTQVFFCSQEVGGIAAVAKGAANATLIAPSVMVFALGYDDEAAYSYPTSFTPNALQSGSVVRIANNYTMTTISNTVYGISNRGTLAVDDSFVYWANAGGSISPGAILKAPKQGGPSTTIAVIADGKQPNAVAVDESAVYWEAGGNVVRLTK